MLLYIAAQFVTWAVHDGIQQLLFEDPAFAPLGLSMALSLQVVCVVGALLTQACSRPEAEAEGSCAKARDAARAAEEGDEEAGAAGAVGVGRRAKFLSLLNAPACFFLLGVGIALSNALSNGSLAYVSQPVKVRRWGSVGHRRWGRCDAPPARTRTRATRAPSPRARARAACVDGRCCVPRQQPCVRGAAAPLPEYSAGGSCKPRLPTSLAPARDRRCCSRAASYCPSWSSECCWATRRATAAAV